METGLAIIYSLGLCFTIGTILVKPKWFLLSFMCLMAISPTAQYLVYDGVGANYFTTTYQRLILEFTNILLLFVYVIYHKVLPRKVTGLPKIILGILIFWNLIHTVNIANSIAVNRSIIFYLISVFGPSLFVYFIIFSKQITLKPGTISRIVYLFSAFFFSLGIIFFVYRFGKEGSLIKMNFRTAGGIYLSNFAVNAMALFAPFIFIAKKEIGLVNRSLKIVFIVGLILMHVAALSRLGIIVYLMFFLMLRMTNWSTFGKTLSGLAVFAVGAYFVVLNVYDLDLIEVIRFRFVGYDDSFSENTAKDERFRVWAETLNYIKHNPRYLFSGVGISNFRQADPLVLEYSNAHNLFVNVLFERGVFVLSILLVKIVAILALIANMLKSKSQFLLEENFNIKALSFGIIMFLIVETFYNDLFTASGAQSGLFCYLWYFSVALLIKYYLKKTDSINYTAN